MWTEKRTYAAMLSCMAFCVLVFGVVLAPNNFRYVRENTTDSAYYRTDFDGAVSYPPSIPHLLHFTSRGVYAFVSL